MTGPAPTFIRASLSVARLSRTFSKGLCEGDLATATQLASAIDSILCTKVVQRIVSAHRHGGADTISSNPLTLSPP